jgi:hypothetical protein
MGGMAGRGRGDGEATERQTFLCRGQRREGDVLHWCQRCRDR